MFPALSAAALAWGQEASWEVRVTIHPLDSPVSRHFEVFAGGRVECLRFDRLRRTVSARTSGLGHGLAPGSGVRRAIAAVREPSVPVEGDVVTIALASPANSAVSGVLQVLPSPVTRWLGEVETACSSAANAPLALAYVTAARVTGPRRRWIAGHGGIFQDLRKISGPANVTLRSAIGAPGRFLPVPAAALKPLTEAWEAGRYLLVGDAVHEWTLYLRQ